LHPDIHALPQRVPMSGRKQGVGNDPLIKSCNQAYTSLMPGKKTVKITGSVETGQKSSPSPPVADILRFHTIDALSFSDILNGQTVTGSVGAGKTRPDDPTPKVKKHPNPDKTTR
jgi:hypothetical protein